MPKDEDDIKKYDSILKLSGVETRDLVDVGAGS